MKFRVAALSLLIGSTCNVGGVSANSNAGNYGYYGNHPQQVQNQQQGYYNQNQYYGFPIFHI